MYIYDRRQKHPTRIRAIPYQVHAERHLACPHEAASAPRPSGRAGVFRPASPCPDMHFFMDSPLSPPRLIIVSCIQAYYNPSNTKNIFHAVFHYKAYITEADKCVQNYIKQNADNFMEIILL